jgi:aldehyde dehydrogenase (NAD+)
MACKAILRAGAETMKRVTLELGGKSPTAILDDADLAQAIPLALGAGFMNSGQACIAGTRVLVPRSRLGEVEKLAKAAVGEVKIGDPRDPSTTVGPMVSQKQWDRVQRYIRIGIDEGTLLAGGEGRPDGLDGWFVRPTLFTNVRNDTTIAREEIFGPVLSIIPYADDEEAIAIANDTVYGLQAYVLSGDMARARRVADRIVAGRVLINTLVHEPTLWRFQAIRHRPRIRRLRDGGISRAEIPARAAGRLTHQIVNNAGGTVSPADLGSSVTAPNEHRWTAGITSVQE